MKVLKVILIIVVVLVGGYAIWMATLPKEYTLTRSADINATPSKVYAQVVNLETWKNWSYWDLSDSTNVVTYDGEMGTVGASYSWKGEATGEGIMTISALEENKRMDYNIDFTGMGISTGYLSFEESETGTNVTYAFHSDFGFWDRSFKFFLESQIGMAFSASLTNLKEMVEAMPDEPSKPEANIEITDYTAMNYYSVTDQVPMAEMNSEFFASHFAEVGSYLGEDAANLTGAPFAIVEEWDTENKLATIAVSLAVDSEKPGNDRVKRGTTYEGKVLKGIHMGPYEGTGTVHYAIDDFAKENNLQIIGAPWEVYVTDPTTEPDVNKWITEIYYPIMEAVTESTDASSNEGSGGVGNG